MAISVKKIGGVLRNSVKKVSGNLLEPTPSSLLHFDGTDASTTFTDGSGKTWTARGTAQLDTAQKKFGTASGLFDGNSDWIDTPDHDDFAMGSGNFTLDFQVRWNSLPATGGATVVQVLFGQSYNTTDWQGGWVLQSWIWSGANTIRYLTFQMQSTGATPAALVALDWDMTSGITTNTWYHIAIVRYGNSWKMYVDGTSVASTTDSDSMPAYGAVFQVGYCSKGIYGGLGYFNGWIDEFRVLKGIARWTGNFTSPTSAYSSNTVKKVASVSNV